MASIEAFIDFGEDEGITSTEIQQAITKMTNCVQEMKLSLKNSNKGEILKRGLQVGIIGSPNAGKSSLLNCIANRKISIVSPLAGTTRDVIHTSIDCNGFPVIFYDTAGIFSHQS